MITFKQFLLEKERDPQEDFKIYFNFIANASIGGNPTATDTYYKSHRKSIESTAALLRGKFPFPKGKIYRGILLLPEDIQDKFMNPLPNVAYISFSEDKNAARIFADPRSSMSDVVMMMRPKSKGFMIEHHPKEKEVLFYWKWAPLIGLNLVSQIDMHLIMQQKEVIIKQTGRKFSIIPFK